MCLSALAARVSCACAWLVVAFDEAVIICLTVVVYQHVLVTSGISYSERRNHPAVISSWVRNSFGFLGGDGFNGASDMPIRNFDIRCLYDLISLSMPQKHVKAKTNTNISAKRRLTLQRQQRNATALLMTAGQLIRSSCVGGAHVGLGSKIPSPRAEGLTKIPPAPRRYRVFGAADCGSSRDGPPIRPSL